MVFESIKAVFKKVGFSSELVDHFFSDKKDSLLEEHAECTSELSSSLSADVLVLSNKIVILLLPLLIDLVDYSYQLSTNIPLPEELKTALQTKIDTEGQSGILGSRLVQLMTEILGADSDYQIFDVDLLNPELPMNGLDAPLSSAEQTASAQVLVPEPLCDEKVASKQTASAQVLVPEPMNAVDAPLSSAEQTASAQVLVPEPLCDEKVASNAVTPVVEEKINKNKEFMKYILSYFGVYDRDEKNKFFIRYFSLKLRQKFFDTHHTLNYERFGLEWPTTWRFIKERTSDCLIFDDIVPIFILLKYLILFSYEESLCKPSVVLVPDQQVDNYFSTLSTEMDAFCQIFFAGTHLQVKDSFELFAYLNCYINTIVLKKISETFLKVLEPYPDEVCLRYPYFLNSKLVEPNSWPFSTPLPKSLLSAPPPVDQLSRPSTIFSSATLPTPRASVCQEVPLSCQTTFFATHASSACSLDQSLLHQSQESAELILQIMAGWSVKQYADELILFCQQNLGVNLSIQCSDKAFRIELKLSFDKDCSGSISVLQNQQISSVIDVVKSKEQKIEVRVRESAGKKAAIQQFWRLLPHKLFFTYFITKKKIELMPCAQENASSADQRYRYCRFGQQEDRNRFGINKKNNCFCFDDDLTRIMFSEPRNQITMLDSSNQYQVITDEYVYFNRLKALSAVLSGLELKQHKSCFVA